ncbi:hypothetical protein [Mycoplasmopsis cynos]
MLDSNGEKLGVKSKSEALELFISQKMDLVLISVDPKFYC